MMLKVNGEFLDFNDFVEVEKRVKLFEKIEETLGDFSYAFSLDPTAKNMRLLGNPRPDVKDKRIYRSVGCDLLDQSGNTLYKGVLKVERVTKTIECSFFSGNYNWISQLSGLLTDLDLSDLQTDLTEGGIFGTWNNTDGVIFPIFDTGALVTRSFGELMVEDFSGCVFVKTLFKRIFQGAGIKTQGDLFKDPIFDDLILSKVTLGPEDIQSLSSYVRVIADQVVTTTPATTSFTKIEFNDDFNYPYFDGSSNAYDPALYRYTAPIKEKVKVDATVIHQTTTPGASPFTTKAFHVYVNGVSVFSKVINQASTLNTDTISHVVTLQAGDYLEAFLEVNNGFVVNVDVNILDNSTIRITPTFIYRTTGQALVPNWTQGQLVSNILALFCCVTDYEPVSKTLTIDFFEGIKSKEPIDLSQHISEPQEDYSEFISSFGKRSLLKYQESDLDDVKQYNLSQFTGYAAGEIQVDNDYIEDTADIVDSDFKAPVSYINDAFDTSFERTQFVELEENGGGEFTSVTLTGFDSAKFNVPDDSIYEVGELVRISESTNPAYDGDYIVEATGVGSGFITVKGPFFQTDATGKITKMLHRIGSDDGVYLFINAGQREISDFSRLNFIWIGGGPIFQAVYSFFNLLNTGLPINDDYKQGLSFGPVDNPLSYQRTLIDKYWGVVSKVLNDPVKVEAIGHIPKIVFNRITPLRPIRIKTEETNNLYYLNRIGGYKESYLPCEVDLIKLS